MASDDKAQAHPKQPNPEGKGELTEEQLKQTTGGTGTVLQYKFGTVFTTKVAWRQGDEGPEES